MRLGLDLVEEPKEAWDLIEGIMDLGSRERHKIAEAVRLGFAWNFAHESASGEASAPLAPMTVGIRRHLGFALANRRQPSSVYLPPAAQGSTG